MPKLSFFVVFYYWIFLQNSTSRHLFTRVAKCQILYTDQIFQTNLYPTKSTEIAKNLILKLNEIEINGYVWGERAENFIKFSCLKKKPHKSWQNYPKTTSYYKTILHFLPQIFYTDISAISVTFRNSVVLMQLLIMMPVVLMAEWVVVHHCSALVDL